VKDRLKGNNELDPDWVKNIAYYVSKSKKEKKKEEYSKLLRGLYLENIRNGMKPNLAFKKAKFVVESFEIFNKL